MSKAERERRHRANLERINRVQQVVGQGDRLRVDHEGTLFERARLLSEEINSHQATELGLAAFDRLLCRLEGREPRHLKDIAGFVAAIRDNRPLPLASLRGLDQAVGDDLLAVLDAFRYARLNLVEKVDGGPRRVTRALNAVSPSRV
jgi:hypothetical protein